MEKGCVVKELRCRSKADGVLVNAAGSTGGKQAQQRSQHLAGPLPEPMIGCVQELDVALEVINNEALHPFKIRMERLFDLFNVSRLAFHLLEEEAQANLDTAVVGEVSKLRGINIVGRSVNFTVLIEQVTKILKELYRELEVLQEIHTGADGETILKLVLCLIRCT